MFDRNDKQGIVTDSHLMTTLIEVVGGLKFLEIVKFHVILGMVPYAPGDNEQFPP